MNTEENTRRDIKANEEKLKKVEQTMNNLQSKPSHQGFQDAKRVIELADQEESLENTLRQKKERSASDW